MAGVLAALIGGAGGARAQQPLAEVTFGTNWIAQAEHGGYYQAVADGTFERYGLKVTIVPGGPRGNNRMLMTVGKLDFYMGGSMIQAFSAAEKDIPTVVVAAHFQKEPQVLLSHPGQGLDTFADLRKSNDILLSKEGVATFFQLEAQLASGIPRLPPGEARIQLVPMGGGAWILVPTADLPEGEQVPLTVDTGPGSEPLRFSLVSRRGEADVQVRVVRAGPSTEEDAAEALAHHLLASQEARVTHLVPQGVSATCSPASSRRGPHSRSWPWTERTPRVDSSPFQGKRSPRPHEEPSASGPTPRGTPRARLPHHPAAGRRWLRLRLPRGAWRPALCVEDGGPGVLGEGP